MSQKKVDLLKVAAGTDSRAIEARLAGEPGDADEALFPAGFAASGVNTSVKIDEVSAERAGPEADEETGRALEDGAEG